jgi:hypothetical protein
VQERAEIAPRHMTGKFLHRIHAPNLSSCRWLSTHFVEEPAKLCARARLPALRIGEPGPFYTACKLLLATKLHGQCRNPRKS